MSDGWKSFLQRMVITTLAVFIAEKLLRGLEARSLEWLVAAALLLGFLNAFLRPVMMLLALPLLLVTLGLFTFVINALLLLFVGWLLQPNFVVDGFWSALKAALIIGIVSLMANMMVGKKGDGGRVRVKVNRPGRRGPPPPANTGSGPVIDV